MGAPPLPLLPLPADRSWSVMQACARNKSRPLARSTASLVAAEADTMASVEAIHHASHDDDAVVRSREVIQLRASFRSRCAGKGHTQIWCETNTMKRTHTHTHKYTRSNTVK